MTDVRLNAWARLTFFDPAVKLPEMRQAAMEVSGFAGHLAEKILSLRGHRQRRFRELRDAAIFCFGISKCVVRKTVYYADHEDQDFDAVTMYDDGQVANFLPLQLKEVPPETLNPTETLDGIFAALRDRKELKDTVVAVKLNRQGTLKLSAIQVPALSVGQLWLFGATSLAQDDWMLSGDLVRTPALHGFRYPA